MPSAFRLAASNARCLAVVASALGLAACGGSSVSGSNSTPPPPPPTTYTLGGTVSGLAGAGLVLASNSASLTVTAGSTSFTFANGLVAGTAYAVTVQSSPNGQTCSVANGSGTIGTANVNNVVVTCSNQAYTIGGTISGLNGSGLVLANGADQLPVSSGATTFTLGARVAFSSTYQVTVATQPAGLSCAVQNGTGTMGAGNVSNIAVTCSDQPYKLGGTITGLASTGLKLTDGTDTVQLDQGATTFNFPTRLNYSASYTVAVVAQPVGMTCSVSSGVSGTMPAGDVSNVAVTCSNQAYHLGGSISGLTFDGLKLTDGTDTTASLNAGTTSFVFQTQVAFGSHYSISVAAQPTGQTCFVSSGSSGDMGAGDVNTVMVTCAVNTYTLGGTVTDLNLTGLVLTDGPEQLSVPANAGTFSMTQGIPYNSSYSVSVAAEPPGLSCTVNHGSGTMPASNVGDVDVVCTSRVWTWAGGTNNVDGLGTYPGAPSTTGSTSYIPSGRSGQMSWQTSDGKFWLFGGSTADNSTTGDFNDVWSYDSGSGQWTWVSGFNTVAASGGSYPVSPNAVGTPPGRQLGATWVVDGTVWMFGGLGTAGDSLNDLWSFNPSSGQWTWVGGTQNLDDAGVYTGPGLTPGARFGAATWIDSAGHLWLFGGAYLVAGNPVPLNDLWMYDTAGGGTWTLVNGGSYTPANANYGTRGTAAASNLPGARGGAAVWVDKTGKVWLFGGAGLDTTLTSGSLNDLWSFDTNTKMWTWVGGSDTINGTWNLNVSTGVYEFAPAGSGSNAAGVAGALEASGTTYIPSGRSASVTWADSTGRLWLFGGLELAGGGAYNDLWAFDPATLQWTWVNGPYPNAPNNKPGTYGSSGVPGPRGQSAGWVDSSGQLWLFGGSGLDGTSPTPNSGNLNDLWKF